MRWLLTLFLLGQNFLLGFQAQQEVSLMNVQATFEFNQSIEFSGELSSQNTVSKAGIVLQYVNGQTFQQDFPLQTDSNFSLQLTPQKINIVPYSRVYYWFVFLFEDGSQYTSPSYWFDYIDNHYDWSISSSKWFDVYTPSDDPALSEQIQSIALSGLKSATALLPASPQLPIKIFVYPSATSLLNATGNGSNESVAGTAVFPANAILVSLTDDLTNTANLERQIPHEISHLLEYQISQSNYSSVPAWLLEGLATLSENYKDSDQSRILNQATNDNSLLKIDQLCSSFPAEPAAQTLAYAESASFTQFLVEKYGLEKLNSIISSAGNNLSCSQLVKNTYSVDLNTLENEWIEQSLNHNRASSNWLNYWPIFLLLLALGILLFFIRNHKRVAKQSGENDV